MLSRTFRSLVSAESLSITLEIVPVNILKGDYSDLKYLKKNVMILQDKAFKVVRE